VGAPFEQNGRFHSTAVVFGKAEENSRAALADSLIESLDDELDEDAEEDWRAEIARRIEELDSGTVIAVSWDETRRQLRARFR
jgi:putative addiction module component (TIGR02574 family)